MNGRLRELQFVDLYLGRHFADVKGLPGANAPRQALDVTFADEVLLLRELCLALHEKQGEPQFAIEHDEVIYRVTVMFDLTSDAIYILRRMTAEIRDISKIGFLKGVTEFVLSANTRGLIVVVGEMGAGKTTTAASLLVARLKAQGGMAVAIEDPPETRLNGVHGEGRCLQVPATAKNGHYRAQIENAMRSGASALLIGEVRSAEAAMQAVQSSLNGLWVVTTIHGNSPVDGLMRLMTLAGEKSSEILAQGLTAVLYQRMERIGEKVRMNFKTLILDGKSDAGIRAKIKSNDLKSLEQDIVGQASRETWG